MSLLISQRMSKEKSLHDYRSHVSRGQLTKIVHLSKKLQHVSIAHLSVTNNRGGVAGSLKSSLPIYTSLGIHMHWYTFHYSKTVFSVFRQLRDIFQGAPTTISDKQLNTYLSFNKQLAREIERKHVDLWIVHDYQPLPAIFFVKKDARRYVWHFHQDSSRNIQNNKFLVPYLKKYLAPFSRYIFSDSSFVPKYLRRSPKVSIFTPCIDPLNEKNTPLLKAQAWEILKPYHINQKYPVISQISRFNPWKDPVGVLEAFLLARRYIPKLQLVFMSHRVSSEDPEQIRLFNELRHKLKSDPQVIFIINAANNDLVVNALQTVSDVILQKSTREGFGQTVTEAMWKGALVIGGNAAGIRTQIQPGANGYIVSSVSECARTIQTLLLHTSSRDKKKMKMKAHQTVKRRFLLPTYIYNNLRTYAAALQ